jgi:H+-transporting ATPase
MVKLSLGGVVAADVQLVEGEILLDQSMLTGESYRSKPMRAYRPMQGALVLPVPLLSENH